jgi:hypothetical protein
MKVSRQGLSVMLLFLIGIPVIADMIAMFFVRDRGLLFGITRFHVSSYIGMLPWYILYLIVAFTIIKLYNKHRDAIHNFRDRIYGYCSKYWNRINRN